MQTDVDQHHKQSKAADKAPHKQKGQPQSRQQQPQLQHQVQQVLQQQHVHDQLPPLMHELQQQHSSVMAKLKRVQKEQCRLLERKIECDRCINMLQQHLAKQRHSKQATAMLNMQPGHGAAAGAASASLSAAVAAAMQAERSCASTGMGSSCAAESSSSSLGSTLRSVLESSSSSKVMSRLLAGVGKQPVSQLLQAMTLEQASQHGTDAQVRACWLFKTSRQLCMHWSLC